MALQVVLNNECGPQKVIAAVYARVSTFNGQDPTMQTRELTEYCQRRGWDVFDTDVDTGVQGKKDSRPELNRLMADAHARRFDVVVCWRFEILKELLREARTPESGGGGRLSTSRSQTRG